jgi:flavin-dependent dehydrogenase
MTEPEFDAVVVGASVAGCTAARLFAQRGARCTFEAIGSRRRSPATLFSPGTLARMARAG